MNHYFRTRLPWTNPKMRWFYTYGHAKEMLSLFPWSQDFLGPGIYIDYSKASPSFRFLHPEWGISVRPFSRIGSNRMRISPAAVARQGKGSSEKGSGAFSGFFLRLSPFSPCCSIMTTKLLCIRISLLGRFWRSKVGIHLQNARLLWKEKRRAVVILRFRALPR